MTVTDTKQRFPNRKWSDEAILAAGRKWAAEHGGRLTSTDWKTATEDHPTSMTVVARFGWRKFQALVGAEIGPSRERRGPPPLPFEPPKLTEAEHRLAERLRS